MKSATQTGRGSTRVANTVRRYQAFNFEVKCALESITTNGVVADGELKHLLNGAASAALDQFVPKSVRTRDGIFFSGERLAKLVADKLKNQIKNGATVADPTCGAGDLLLGCMSIAFPGEFAHETIRRWGQRVIGLDIHPEFVAATRSRLELLAVSRSDIKEPALETESFPLIMSGDFLRTPHVISNADCVVMNPPFGEVTAPDECTWSSGKVQQSALFVEVATQVAKPGQEIVAVLPDVLRSGTRYARWRTLLHQQCEVIGHEIYGRFDAKTDVDVFILHLKKRADALEKTTSSASWNSADAELNEPNLEDHFTVTVGAVVPHRHQGDRGQWHPYLHVDSAPIDAETSVTGKRRFNGRLHKAPFVVLRRTSSPGDGRRAVPSLVLGPDQIAVENHLIVLQPKNGRLSSCRELMQLLQTGYVDAWLNQTIRCRHLTTTVLKKLPLIGWK